MARDESRPMRRPDRSSRTAEAPTGFATQLQQIGDQALEAFRRDADLEAQEIREASTASDVATLQLAFAATQFGHLARTGEQVLAAALDAQSQWLRLIESQSAQMLRPWLGSDPCIGTSSAQALLQPPTDLTPTGLLGSAQSAWRETARLWLGAITHDLQQARVPPAR